MNHREVRALSKWTRLVTRTVTINGSDEPQEFHSLDVADYVCIVGITKQGEIPLVRQYRPAVEGFTLELPGGLRDANEHPGLSAKRELFEETGYLCETELVELGCLLPDSGRLENKLWCYAATLENQISKEWKAEADVERIVVQVGELKKMLIDGTFNHALHVAALGLALTKGIITW